MSGAGSVFCGQGINRTLRQVLRGAPLCACLLLLASAVQAAPKVVVSIAPVHALVAAVMEGVGAPVLLIPVGTSPHAYALRPSQRRLLDSAQLLIWVGSQLEPFLRKPIGELADSVTVIELATEHSVHRAPTRAAGVFVPRARVNEERREDRARTNGEHSHEHSDRDHGDSHVWLNPDNAIAIVKLVTRVLAAQDTPSALHYEANARRMVEQIRALDREIDTLLSTVRDVPYVVLHDAYQGFENHYHLHPVAAITESPAKMPGTRRVLAIRRHLRDAGVRCVFSEPRYQSRLLDALTEGLDVRRGVLDPLGRKPSHGANAWLELMRRLATSLHSCLSAP